ncbi:MULTISPECIES: YicC/YloC family endoribonuclease [Heyndrickxia]|uniref:YicC/YloC family endoribonuclease n=1 Tax=Heyndrickxia TaxID=2837504 RepID=UPI00047BE7F9|nr:YicC/YloC family endoribonuclease [Heyndrickxia coagulans]AWP36687.1 YicC family protein [Heyndrickxia coagulans]QDI62188.1 YicC family protein [Heyndrickxia coagulans]
MVLSMTGYGRGRRKTQQFSVTVEIKSVNHRFCEYQIRMPKQLVKVEEELKKIIGNYVQRGRIDVFVTITGEGLVKRRLRVDWDLLDEYHRFLSRIREQYGIESGFGIRELLNREDLVTIEEIEEDNEEILTLVLEACKEAAGQLRLMREKEGSLLRADLEKHLQTISKQVDDIKTEAQSLVSTYRLKLEKRMQELSGGRLDEARLVQEAALFADKSDIHEEVTRLESHLIQFGETLALDEPIGRKLDFMIQEMNREVNTIGSKANASGISTAVVELKTVLEKMREQVQNIE